MSDQMTDVMIDLETLGVNQSAAIVSIGAVKFNVLTGEIGDAYYRCISLDDALLYGDINAVTLKWWMTQTQEAQSQAFNGNSKIEETLSEFREWSTDSQTPCPKKFWGNGPTFDISKLEYHYDLLDMAYPWEYNKVRDVRTIVELASEIGMQRPTFKPEDGEAHVAVEDAIFQAKYVSSMYRKLIGIND